MMSPLVLHESFSMANFFKLYSINTLNELEEELHRRDGSKASRFYFDGNLITSYL